MTQDRNSATIVYLQVGEATVSDLATLDVLGNMLYETAFNQLRTLEQLGYIVFGRNMDMRGIGGLVILVQSERVSEKKL